MILHRWINFTDKDGDSIGEIAAFQSTTGKTGLRILGIGEYNSNEITHGITFGIEGDGTRTIGVTDILAWQEGLKILPSTGGDMTGNLHFKTDSIDRSINPSSDIAARGIEFLDVNGKRLGYIDMARRSIGRQDLRLVATNETTTGTIVENNFQIQVARDGTCTYSIPSPQNFWSALGGKALGKKDIAGLPIKAIDASSAAYNTAKSAGDNFQINVDIPAEPDYIFLSPMAIFVSGGNNNSGMSLRGFDVDGLATGSASRVKTYWHTQTAIPANSAIVIGIQAIYASVYKIS